MLFFEAGLYYFLSVIIHELGHYGMAQYYGYEPEIYFEKFKIWTELKYEAYGKHAKRIIFAGIMAGFYFLIMITLSHRNPFIGIALLLPYFYGCRDDFKRLEAKK